MLEIFLLLLLLFSSVNQKRDQTKNQQGHREKRICQISKERERDGGTNPASQNQAPMSSEDTRKNNQSCVTCGKSIDPRDLASMQCGHPFHY